MAFNLTPTETFKETVTVNVKQANGAWKQDSYIAEFKRATEEERKGLASLSDVDLVRDRLVGWSMKDEQKNDVPFTPENLDALCSFTAAVRETAVTFWQANLGAKQKN
ncbi:hypothetical protein [Xylophilus sp. Leaf220]|uniref:hypothetical protein n=1 Tax=Xylophilus sp. Leaf220 TaxID=1735686 RepID=UPI00070238A2|nr:hypothetical protein [Xylophilus sp. Leaf220]KQM68774.1 hypothetical protein ASE76_13840 [Xylophilus sp. Leaf220]